MAKFDELVELALHYRTIADINDYCDEYDGTCDELGFDNTALLNIVMAVEYELRKGIDALSRFELGDFNIAANEALHELSMEYNNSCEAIGRYTH